MRRLNLFLIAAFLFSTSAFAATCKDVLNKELKNEIQNEELKVTLLEPHLISKEIPEVFGLAEWAPENLVILRRDQNSGVASREPLRIEIEHTGYEVENGELKSSKGYIGYLREIPATSPLFGTTFKSDFKIALDRYSTERIIVTSNGNTYKIWDERVILETEAQTSKKRLFVFDEFYSVTGRGVSLIKNSADSYNAKKGISIVNIGDTAFFITPDLQLTHLGSIGKFHSWSQDGRFAIFTNGIGGTRVAIVNTDGAFQVKFVNVGESKNFEANNIMVKSISIENKRVMGFETSRQVLKFEFSDRGYGAIDPGAYMFVDVFFNKKVKLHTELLPIEDLFQ